MAVMQMNALRRAASSPALRSVLLRPRVRAFVARVLAVRFLPSLWALATPVQFLVALVLRRDPQIYRVRDSEVRLVLGHDLGSIELVHEIFAHPVYLPPADIAARIPADPRIVDLGANVGAFAAFAFDNWPAAMVTCVEPDDANLRVLRAVRDLNGFGESMTIIPRAASVSGGPVPFHSGLGTGSRIGVEGAMVESVDPLGLLASCDFAKIDIEGAEWEFLRDGRLRELGPLVLVMEYHRRFPGDTDAGAGAIAALRDAGFTIGHHSPNEWGHGMVWAWR